jgi:hypothetical protein
MGSRRYFFGDLHKQKIYSGITPSLFDTASFTEKLHDRGPDGWLEPEFLEFVEAVRRALKEESGGNVNDGGNANEANPGTNPETNPENNANDRINHDRITPDRSYNSPVLLSKIRKLLESHPSVVEHMEGVYSFPCFREELCDLLLREIDEVTRLATQTDHRDPKCLDGHVDRPNGEGSLSVLVWLEIWVGQIKWYRSCILRKLNVNY